MDSKWRAREGEGEGEGEGQGEVEPVLLTGFVANRAAARLLASSCNWLVRLPPPPRPRRVK